MNRALRRRHLRMIVVIGALVGVLFLVAIALRPAPVPTGDLPTAAVAPQDEPQAREESADGP